MNIQELLLELRRNPDQNVKLAGHQEAADYIVKHWKDTSKEEYGVSMTNLPKLGINPRSAYNTPLGIYSYPASYYVEKKYNEDNNPNFTGLDLEFQDDAAYIQIFKLNTDDILELDLLDDAGMKSYVERLLSQKDKIATLTGISVNDVIDRIVNAYDTSATNALINSPGGRLWYILRELSINHTFVKKFKTAKNSTATRDAIIWNSLLRLIGADVIMDHGDGIIHHNEPTQLVVLNPSAITLVKTIANATPKTPKVANIVRTHNSAKLINTGGRVGYFVFLATYKIKGQPDERIKLHAWDEADALKQSKAFWNKKFNHMIHDKDITIEYSQISKLK